MNLLTELLLIFCGLTLVTSQYFPRTYPPPPIVSQIPPQRPPLPRHFFYQPRPVIPRYSPESVRLQQKILGLIMTSGIEKTLVQMHMLNPEILNTLTGKQISLDREYLKNGTHTPGRRTLFAPTIHNTIVNENKNQNQNLNSGSGNYMPFPVPVDPNFPLLTHLLSSLMHPEHKQYNRPIRICFEL